MELIWISGSGAWLSEQVIIIKHSTTGYPSPALFSHPTLTKYTGRQDSPTQHSIRAQGDILMTSGGSTPTLRHKTNATHPVFICHNTEQLAYARNYQGYDKWLIPTAQARNMKHTPHLQRPGPDGSAPCHKMYTRVGHLILKSVTSAKPSSTKAAHCDVGHQINP
jgi:hypothetical protein